MSLNQQNKFQIIEHLKMSFYMIILIIIFYLLFLSVLTFNIISSWEPTGAVALVFIWLVSIIFIFIAIWLMRGLTKTRSFVIDNDKIIITVPKRPEFQILWSNIISIQVKKHGMGRSLTFEIIFITKETQRSFRYTPGTDFRIRTNKKIIDGLETWCNKMGKDFVKYK